MTFLRSSHPCSSAVFSPWTPFFCVLFFPWVPVYIKRNKIQSIEIKPNSALPWFNLKSLSASKSSRWFLLSLGPWKIKFSGCWGWQHRAVCLPASQVHHCSCLCPALGWLHTCHSQVHHCSCLFSALGLHVALQCFLCSSFCPKTPGVISFTDTRGRNSQSFHTTFLN